MGKGNRIWLLLLLSAAVLSLILWIARPRPEIWRTETILVEDASGRVQGEIESRRAIRKILRLISKSSEEPWEDLSGMEPTAQLEFLTPENGYGPVYYYEAYGICVTAPGVWVRVPEDFFDTLWQSMDGA